MRSLFIALFLIILTSCSPSKALESGLRPQERAVIRGAIDDIARGDAASLAKKTPPELTPKLQPAFGKMQQMLPSPPLEVTLTNANWTVGSADRSLHAVYEVHGRNGWALVEATAQTSGGRTLLTGIYIAPSAGNPRNLNGFSLAGADASRWTMLAAMLAAVAVTIAALVRIWRSGRFERPWLWTIGALIGITSLKMNWSTGQMSFQPISLQLFSASAMKQPIYAPWVMGVSVPLFAIIALFRRRHERAEQPGHDAGAVPQSDSV
jgi:hypothetical protein